MLDTINAIAIMWLIPAVILVIWGAMREGVFTMTRAFSGTQTSAGFNDQNRKEGRKIAYVGLIMIALSIAWFYVFSKITPSSTSPANGNVSQTTQQ